MTAPTAVPTFLTLLTIIAAMACQPADTSEVEDGAVTPDKGGVPGLIAMNAFYYYDDVDAAWAFYSEILGLQTVVDYGFAKIMRVSESSYLTLVNAADGMHSTDEPKSVTFAFVTEEVEGWYDYLRGQGVTVHSELNVGDGRPHEGFVAADPEGYLLEFERFNPHTENEALIPDLAKTVALYAAPNVETNRPANLGVQATILWLYYDDLLRAEEFYRGLLEQDVIVDQGWAKVLPVSSSGYLGLVDGERGLHQATESKAVTVSFITRDIEAWFNRMRDRDDFEFRSPEIGDESGKVRVFVGYDPEGYFLEWDTFLDQPGNEDILKLFDR